MKVTPMSVTWVTCRKSWGSHLVVAQVSDPELRDAEGDLVKAEGWVSKSVTICTSCSGI